MHKRPMWIYPMVFLVIGMLILSACAPALAVGAQTKATANPTPAADDAVWTNIKTTGVMNVGISIDYPPFEYYNDQYQADGFDVALIAELSKRMGIAANVQNITFDGLFGALELKQIDMAISAISITPERQEVVNFSRPYYLEVWAVLSRQDTNMVITNPNQLAAFRVGVQRGTVYEGWIQKNLVDTGIMPADNLLVYNLADEAVRDLTELRVDLVMVGAAAARAYATEQNLRIAGRSTVPDKLGIALRKDSPQLQDEINRTLLEMQQDGTLGKLILKYLRDPDPLLPAACVDGMKFVSDVTYPDNNMTTPAKMNPGQSFVKTWRVQNIGTCTWTTAYKLTYAYGNVPAAQMNGQPAMIQSPVAPGQTVDISVPLVAPTQPGTYQGFWQMVNAENIPFGQVIWVGITVPNPNNPTATAMAAPAVAYFRADPSTITLNQCTTLSWSITGTVSSVVILRNGQTMWSGAPVIGSQRDCPGSTGTITYTLQATGPSGTARSEIRVTVNSAPAPTATRPAPTATKPPAATPTTAPPSIAGAWGLVSLRGSPLISGTSINANFDNNQNLNGFAGCNTYNGRYLLSGSSISITNLSSSKLECEDPAGVMTQESDYLSALQRAASFRKPDANTLILLDTNGSEILRYSIAMATPY
jgi:polar amino acid transport system substrate-binding protein